MWPIPDTDCPFARVWRFGMIGYIMGKVFMRASSPGSSISFGSGLKTSRFLCSVDLGESIPLLFKRAS